ncbi:MAG: hypothetical protein KDA88_24505 [Planctomycetaceae bacterium]|nr:hypothetical protein [Planctomycetaceae bacterium]MCA9031226.1 hypothetical protein [Planctomycetaceae bacterium]MCB9953174.1 hypothetical protein [Planctomycetaceae bacterium]
MNNPKRLSEAISFIEELAWLIDSKKSLRLSQVASDLRELATGPETARKVGDEYTSPNPNIHFLIGVLPRLFQDDKLFPSNAMIAQFAEEVLDIEVPRYEKRSKYELIGLIVCETDQLNDEKLNQLVRALSEITRNEEKLRRIRAARQSGKFSWNNTIRQLSDDA